MKDVDQDRDDTFDEPTAVSKVNRAPGDPPTPGNGPLESAVAIGGNSAMSDDQIFESMPSVSESISRAPKKPKDDWASSSEFDALGEGNHQHREEQAADSFEDDDDQDFDAPTGLHTRTPTPPPDHPDHPSYRAPSPSPPVASPAELSFEEAPREELYASESPFEAQDAGEHYDEHDDEFAVEVEVEAEIEVEVEAPAEGAAEMDDETFGAMLEEAWAGCEPQRDLPTKLQRVAFAEAAVKVQTILLPNRDLQRSKNDLLAKLNKQVEAQKGLISYTPEWRACDKELGALLPQLEKLVSETDKKIPASRFRGPYLGHSFHRATCLNYLEQDVRSGDIGIAWWERISSLAVASATKVLPSGDRELLPVSEVSELWTGRLPVRKMQRSTIVGAFRFFQDCIAKIAAMSDPSEFFKSGLALEVIGYQVSLREDIFRPEVLYACADFYTHLSNWLNSDAHRPLQKTLDGDFTEAFEKAGSIFGL